MATHDYVLANQSGSSFRTDLNNALAAVVSNNSNSSEPSTTYAYMLWVDTSNNLVKLRNSANNAWITLFTTAGGLDVDAASNFNEDVTFTGASANVTWDKSTDDLIFDNGAKAIFGTGSDGIEIFHDGSHSYLSDTGTGNLKLTSNGAAVSIEKSDGENIAIFRTDGAVELYHNGIKTFETESDGIAVIGPEGGNAFITFKADEGDDNADLFDLGVYDGGPFKIQNKKSGSWEDSLVITGDAAVDLYYDNAKKLSTASTGVEIQNAGNNRVLKLDHTDGDHCYITFMDDDTSDDGQVRVGCKNNELLFYAEGSEKAKCTSTGIEVSGKVIAEVTGTNTVAATFINSGSHSDGTELQLQNKTGTPADGDQTGYLQFSGNDSGGNMTIFNAIISTMDDVTNNTEDGSLYFYCRDNGSFNQKLRIASDGTFTGSSSNDISDQRLKENIATVVDPIAKIKALKGRTFTWKPEAKLPAGTKYGFIAQEVESVVSDLVDNKHGIRQFDKDDNLIPQDEKGKVNMDEGTTDAKSVNAIGVVPILVEALKEALTKIETLEAKVAALEGA